MSWIELPQEPMSLWIRSKRPRTVSGISIAHRGTCPRETRLATSVTNRGWYAWSWGTFRKTDLGSMAGAES
jgi:hypothetical protein